MFELRKILVRHDMFHGSIDMFIGIINVCVARHVFGKKKFQCLRDTFYPHCLFRTGFAQRGSGIEKSLNPSVSGGAAFVHKKGLGAVPE